MVCPSGVARASNAVASMPLAPERLSTITCWPQLSVNRAASIRALMSVAAPGGYPSSMRTGRVGDHCGGVAASAAEAAIIAESEAGDADPHGGRSFRPVIAPAAA